MKTDQKLVIYQVLPRLFGNTNSRNKPWGTIEENGVGKFNDFTDRALMEIRNLGVTHIWYTGVLHHCVIRDYTAYGISNDDPDVVKGRAGSPYAVKDYYNVNPDLALDPARRLNEFEELIERTHKNGLKLLIDIIPNHVARNYRSISKPPGISDFGADDDKSVAYTKNNNFYYIPGQKFRVPDFEEGFIPLGGEDHPLADGEFDEFPAKWTGNGSRLANPSAFDWYETVKINFGISPEGKKDFDELPEGFEMKNAAEHHAFWKDKDIPDSWRKFEQIAQYWLDKGVDGFRYDMAQLVPLEFWSFLNASIKQVKSDALLISEIYIPELYRNFIYKGKMDYLYDKVQGYDTLRQVIQGQGSTDMLPGIIQELSDIEHHMLHFLENHDEHRLASPEFAGNAFNAMPAMVVSATIGTSPVMVYFGQEVGEEGKGDGGYGKSGRTTIFDYWGVPAHQRWMNKGAFDGGSLTKEEKMIRSFYRSLLNFTINSRALMGEYGAIHAFNRANSPGYSHKQFSCLRFCDSERLLIICNFDKEEATQFELKIPAAFFPKLGLRYGTYRMTDKLSSGKQFILEVKDTTAETLISIQALESFILEF